MKKNVTKDTVNTDLVVRQGTVKKLRKLNGIEIKKRQELSEILGLSKVYSWAFINKMSDLGFIEFNTIIRLTQKGKDMANLKFHKNRRVKQKSDKQAQD